VRFAYVTGLQVEENERNVQYRVIQSTSRKSNGAFGEIAYFFIFAITSELRRFYVGVAFIIVIVGFHKGETFRFT
jgi:hypothetical protein